MIIGKYFGKYTKYIFFKNPDAETFMAQMKNADKTIFPSPGGATAQSCLHCFATHVIIFQV